MLLPSYRRVVDFKPNPLRPMLAAAIAFLLLTLAESKAAETGEVRPALLGNGPTSLINVISSERLLKHGQKTGIVEFTCGINRWGYPGGILTYGGTPDTEALSQELLDQFDRAKFIPAQYHGHAVDAMVNGTLLYMLGADGKPRLRIFLNQDKAHLDHGDDFIAPQLIWPVTSKFMWFDAYEYRIKSGMAAVQITVDSGGKLVNASILREFPPGQGFGQSVMKRIYTGDYTPPFLNGKAVTARTVWQIPFRAYGYGKQWLH